MFLFLLKFPLLTIKKKHDRGIFALDLKVKNIGLPVETENRKNFNYLTKIKDSVNLSFQVLDEH